MTDRPQDWRPEWKRRRKPRKKRLVPPEPAEWAVRRGGGRSPWHVTCGGQWVAAFDTFDAAADYRNEMAEWWASDRDSDRNRSDIGSPI
jgi:hypothetical protein